MNEFKTAPIAVIVYNRINTFKQCIDALKNNSLAVHSDLYIVSDASGKTKDDMLVDEVRSFSRQISGFKTVNFIFREKNIGGSESGMLAEKEIIEKHGRIIMLEDDVIVSKAFLAFMNNALDFYENDKSVFSISGYCPPVAYTPKWRNRMLVAPFHCPWGYATWADRYQTINPRINPYPSIINNKPIVNYIIKNCLFMIETLRSDYYQPTLGCIDVRLSFQVMLNKMVSVYPAISLTRNIGLDGNGFRMPRNDELMRQSIADDYNVDNYEKVIDLDFQKRFVRNGTENKKKQRILYIIYKLSLRERLDFIVIFFRKIKSALKR